MEAIDPLPMPKYKVGLTYNLKKGIKSDVVDIEAEYDSFDTVEAIKSSLEKMNMEVILLEADNSLFSNLSSREVDIVFNIAEGIQGRGREAQVPAILNFLRIPFAGSDETTLCISLDKALAKRILSTFKIKTPNFKLIHSMKDIKNHKLKYPIIVKPNAEGSSKGIPDSAIAENLNQLKELIDRDLQYYCQSILLEEYISGREFTVGIVGNGDDTFVFPPMEICYKEGKLKYNIYSYNVKQNYKTFVEYNCPAELDEVTLYRMTQMAADIYRVLECRDFSRIDFRIDGNGQIYFIEINPLPGLAPGYSDFPMLAAFNGVEYEDLIKMILNSALKRYGMEMADEKRELKII